MTSREWRYILHADLDAFYASVEQLDNPQYRGRPVVVGGSPEERGVVAAASYEARKYNVRSAMPMRTAVRLCPELVRVSPRFGRYRELSGAVMDLFMELTPLVEPMSLDEAYLDVSAVASWDAMQETAGGLKARVMERTGLVVSIGGGTSKTVAKVASQLSKPNGLLLVAPDTEREFLAPLNAGILSGVGAKTAETLGAHGVATLGDLASRDAAWLRQTFGRRGPELRERAMGTDGSEVTRHRETKSVSSEETMTRDTGEESELVRRVEDLTRGVASRLRRHELAGKTVTLKLRLSDFTTMTRSRTLPAPTADAEVIAPVACDLLRRELGPSRRFRLVGVGVSGFQETQQLPLFPDLQAQASLASEDRR